MSRTHASPVRVPPNSVHPGLLRRLMAMLYDAFLVIALLLIASFWLPLLPESFSQSAAGRAVKLGYALTIVFAFFGWFWTHGGQTLGMRAWRLQLATSTGQAIGWRRALIRYCAAWLAALPVGLGYFWIWIDAQHRAWHDHWSSSHLVLLPKTNKQTNKPADTPLFKSDHAA